MILYGIYLAEMENLKQKGGQIITDVQWKLA